MSDRPQAAEPGNEPVRARFTTADPDLAHSFIRDVYAEHKLRVSGRHSDFAFDHSAAAAGGFSLARMRHTMAVEIDFEPLKGMLAVDRAERGHLQFEAGRDTVRADLGEPVLVPTSGPWRCAWDDPDVAIVTLDEAAVAEYAAHMCGAEVVFTGMRPLSGAMATYWRNTVAHVRDHVLGDPVAAASPMVLAGAFRQLAAALLSTFPNTALAARIDPSTSGRDGISAAAVRRVVQHLDSHAGEPLDLGVLTRIAGAPLLDLERAFHRVHGVTLAEYQHRARLRGAHHDLQVAEPAEDRTPAEVVATIAARWGFSRPARFALAYRAAYGRAPARTLRT